MKGLIEIPAGLFVVEPCSESRPKKKTMFDRHALNATPVAAPLETSPIGPFVASNRDLWGGAHLAGRPNFSRMATPPRRVEISFDREREVLRAVADVVARMSGRAPRRSDAHRSRVPLTNVVRLIGPDPAVGTRADRSPLDDRPKTPLRTPQSPLAPEPRASVSRDESTAKASRYLGALVAAYGPLSREDAADLDAPLVDLLVVDATALAALARGNVRARAQLAHAVGALARIVVPATALVDAAHQRVAEAVGTIVSIDASIARTAARLLLETPGAPATSALAVACAMHARRSAILSAEETALASLARATHRDELYVFAI